MAEEVTEAAGTYVPRRKQVQRLAQPWCASGKEVIRIPSRPPRYPATATGLTVLKSAIRHIYCFTELVQDPPWQHMSRSIPEVLVLIDFPSFQKANILMEVYSDQL